MGSVGLDRTSPLTRTSRRRRATSRPRLRDGARPWNRSEALLTGRGPFPRRRSLEQSLRTGTRVESAPRPVEGRPRGAGPLGGRSEPPGREGTATAYAAWPFAPFPPPKWRRGTHVGRPGAREGSAPFPGRRRASAPSRRRCSSLPRSAPPRGCGRRSSLGAVSRLPAPSYAWRQDIVAPVRTDTPHGSDRSGDRRPGGG